jgi:acyl-CoA synthetase (AMP-forming)/AMP-acid ligase II
VSGIRPIASRIDEATRERWRSRGYLTGEALGWMLETSAEQWGDRPAVITARGTTSYAELQRESSAVARTLVERGIRPGDTVCWMLPTDAHAIAVASAIWRIGAISSPIVPIYGAREMTAVIDLVRPAAIVTDALIRSRDLPGEFDAVLEQTGHTPRARLVYDGASAGWGDARAAGPGSLPDGVRPAIGDDPALILFTSGTESMPKGAVHSVAGIGHEVRSCVTEWGVTFRDRMFMASPMTHVTGLLQGFLIPARTGAAAVLMDRWDAAQAVDLIEATGASYMAGATPFLRELDASYRSQGLERSAIRQYCCGGAAVPPDLIRRVGELGIAAYRAWGMTEAPTTSFANELDPIECRADTDGRLAPGIEVRILDDDGEELPPGEVGAMQLRGPEMMLGYLQEDADERAFRPGGWFDTGDVGSVDADGWVRISGRTKDIINRGGEKYSAREIEEAVAKHPDVAAVAIVAVPGGRLGERIGAVVVTSRPDLDVAELGRHVTSLGLAKQKQPEELVVVDAIPTNATGKVDKRAVLALFPDAGA